MRRPRYRSVAVRPDSCRPAAKIRGGRRDPVHGAEEQASGERDGEGEGEHPAVGAHRLDAGNCELRGEERRQETRGPRGEEQAQGPAREREQGALGEQLLHESKAARAERRANGELLLSRRVAGEHQVRHVRARNQQHQGDDAEQDEQAGSHVPDERVHEGHHVRADMLVRPRVSPRAAR